MFSKVVCCRCARMRLQVGNCQLIYTIEEWNSSYLFFLNIYLVWVGRGHPPSYLTMHMLLVVYRNVLVNVNVLMHITVIHIQFLRVSIWNCIKQRFQHSYQLSIINYISYIWFLDRHTSTMLGYVSWQRTLHHDRFDSGSNRCLSV